MSCADACLKVSVRQLESIGKLVSRSLYKSYFKILWQPFWSIQDNPGVILRFDSI